MDHRRKGKALAIAVAAACAAAAGDAPWSAIGSAAAAEAATCKLSMGTGVKRCRVDVKVTAKGMDSCDIDIPDAEQRELVLSGQQKLRIVWRLNDGDGSYLFCRYAGDGVFLKKPIRLADQQVSRMKVMKDKDDDDPSGDANTEHGCYERFKWTFENRRTATVPAGTQYDYEIRVRDSTFARTCRWDPWVRNG
jgi:hypothetical protein